MRGREIIVVFGTPSDSLMGYLAVSEGFYGAHGAATETLSNGECLFVADPDESWVFHIAPLPPGVAAAAGVAGADGGHSAVWVAQRVPRDHFVVAANRFIIRDVIEVAPGPSTPVTRSCAGDDYRHSVSLWPVASYLSLVRPEPKPFESLPPERRGVRTRADVCGTAAPTFLDHTSGQLANPLATMLSCCRAAAACLLTPCRCCLSATSSPRQSPACGNATAAS